MYLFRFATENGPHLGIEDEAGGRYDATLILPDVFATIGTWLAQPDPLAAVETIISIARDERLSGAAFYVAPDVPLLAPVDTQEVWASGVTYERSKKARMEESKDAGGGDFYDRVYAAERPELFFKSVGWRVIGPGGEIRIRRDSAWNVPEPEMALVIAANGQIVAITVGNDVSSRSIEGENPLYLPQAKTYDGACALGPRLRLLTPSLDLLNQTIRIEIRQGIAVVFIGETTTARLHRSPEELVGFLFRETSFPAGAFLLTGTGIVPDDDFTLQSGDIVEITIGDIGTLINTVP